MINQICLFFLIFDMSVKIINFDKINNIYFYI